MSFFGTLFGNDAADAANRAAADTYAKQQAATSGLKAYGDTLPDIYKNLYAPYASAGAPAIDMLKAGLGLGGDQQAFTRAYQGLPGYQSGLATGQQAAERGLNAGGGLNSGAALKALYRYGSDYENNRSGDYMSRLANMAGIGLQGTQGQAQGVGANTGIRQTAFGGEMGSAGTIGQGMVAGAQAQQDALGNLLKAGTYLGGAALGGPFGKGLSGWAFGSGGGSGGW